MRIGKTAFAVVVAVCGLGAAIGLGGLDARHDAGHEADRVYREAKEQYTPNTPRHHRAREFGRAFLAGGSYGDDQCSRYLGAYGFAFIAFNDRVRTKVRDAYLDEGCAPTAMRDLDERLVRAMGGKADKPKPAARPMPL